MFRFKTVLAALSAGAVLLTGLSANAAMVTVRDNPDNGGSVFADGLGRTISVQYDGAQRNVGAGVFSLQYRASGSDWTDFLTLCLQISERLTLPLDHERRRGTSYFDRQDADLIGILYGHFFTGDHALRDATSSAAVQAIVWEIAEDGATDFDLSEGTFQLLSDDVLTRAEEIWTAAISGVFEPIGFDVFEMTGTQDLLVSEVPIPGAIPLLFSGLAGLGFASRKTRLSK